LKQLLTGNEAVARGAYEAGVSYASAYPGTPSTEILENIGKLYKEHIIAEWAPNEKVAFESAIGASVLGARSMAAMKHVGVNVAADPLFTFAYTGVTGGMMFVSADDPGLHSSQDEQDNRYYAKSAKVAMLEPSNSQESKDMAKRAFAISEEFDIPVMLRMTTRVCHSKSVVEFGDIVEQTKKTYVKNTQKYDPVPAISKILHETLEKRLLKLEEYSNECDLNYEVPNGGKIGVIAAGVTYQYAREVFGERASYLKLGMTFPLPMNKIRDFAGRVETLYVIEELEPFMEEQIKTAGIDCVGKQAIPRAGELNPSIIREALLGETAATIEYDKSVLAKRPPTLCAGCPHRGFFYQLSKEKNIIISSDIGCYALSGNAPLYAKDFAFCMGGGFSVAHGAQKIVNKFSENCKLVGVMGDSTFFHSGMTSLLTAVYNKSNALYCIMDNRITAMTGHQENPGSGFSLDGEETNATDIEAVVRALGVKNARTINPLNLAETKEAIKWGISQTEPAVLITRWPCVLKRLNKADIDEFGDWKSSSYIDPDKCIGCKGCVKTGCPALVYDDDTRKVTIDKTQCVGCEVCVQVCPVKAIKKEGK
jgi:indolepyruvate ferredoxin oxidoreductase alpha subunit